LKEFWIMPEQRDQQATSGSLRDRLRDNPGLAPLLAEAEATWRGRAIAAGVVDEAGKPAWRTFEDAFPTFYEFTNRPR
jgi:hypothetical protein